MKIRKIPVHIQNKTILNDLLSNLNYFAQIPRFKFGVKLQNISFFWNGVTKNFKVSIINNTGFKQMNKN